MSILNCFIKKRPFFWRTDPNAHDNGRPANRKMSKVNEIGRNCGSRIGGLP